MPRSSPLTFNLLTLNLIIQYTLNEFRHLPLNPLKGTKRPVKKVKGEGSWMKGEKVIGYRLMVFR